MTIEFRVLKSNEAQILTKVAPEVFDYQIDERLCKEFLQDPRHHIAVAINDGIVVGFASAVNYIHPDKTAELWINEVGVAPTYRNRGLAKALLELLFDLGRQLRCNTAWVLTERTNMPAMRLYQSSGGTEAQEDIVMFSFGLEK